MTVQQTLAELVAIDSVSSRSNKAIADFLVQACEKLGLRVKPFPYTDDNGVEKLNLIALAGTEFSDTTAVELALVGHTDTVPFDPNWEEALKLTERDGKLFGRGACDTKAFIAAALSAIAATDLDELKRPLALIFTADEEIGLVGAKRLAKSKALSARYAIVGEPTSLRPMRAGKGYCVAEILIKGREGHSAYPALGTSAVFGGARLVTRIEEIGEQLKSEEHAAFEPPFTTLNVGLLRGGTAKNVIAGECRMTLEWRPIPGQEPNRVLNMLYSAIELEKQNHPEFVCEVNAARADEGFETSSDSGLVQLLQELSGLEAWNRRFRYRGCANGRTWRGSGRDWPRQHSSRASNGRVCAR